MNVKETKLSLMYSPIEQAILLKGNHGIGKSAVVRQVAEALGVSFIDIRLAQNDVGDMKGLPFQGMGRTFFAPPDWFPIKTEDAKFIQKSLSKEQLEESVAEITAGKYGDKGILFLDEINRAQQEVQQAAFELVLDRRLNMRNLPDGWRVVAAINSNANLYDVNDMGPALISRFEIIDFKPTVEEWWEWAEGEDDMIAPVISFTKKYPNLLDPTDEMIETATATCERIYDRRSYHMLSRSILSFQKAHKDGHVPFDILDKSDAANNFLLLKATGFLGNTVAVKFKNYIELEYKVLDAEKILNAFDKTVEAHMTKLKNDGKIPEMAGYNNQITEFITANVNGELNEKQMKNLFSYFKMLPNEVASNLWKSLLTDCKEIATKWYESSDEITKYVGSVFTM